MADLPGSALVSRRDIDAAASDCPDSVSVSICGGFRLDEVLTSSASPIVLPASSGSTLRDVSSIMRISPVSSVSRRAISIDEASVGTAASGQSLPIATEFAVAGLGVPMVLGNLKDCSAHDGVSAKMDCSASPGPLLCNPSSSLHPSTSSSEVCPVRSAWHGQPAGSLPASSDNSGTFSAPEQSRLHASSNFKLSDCNFPPLESSLEPSVVPPSSPPHPVPGPPCEDPVVKGNAHPSWASLVKEPSAKLQLKFIKPVNSSAVAGRLRIKLPSDVASKGASVWKHTLVGFFLDKLPFSLVQATALRLWGKHGLTDVLCNGFGFFFFKFSVAAGLNAVLEGGPWHFGGRPIFIKLWTPGMNLSKEGCKRVPIWAHFYNVPLELWTDEGLSYIASTVGKPLHADSATAAFRRLNYARICIEINIEDTLPNAVDIELDDGSCLEIQIEYNWVPKKCSVCKEFGHLSKNCKRVTQRLWVPKSSQQPVPSSEDWKLVNNHAKEAPVSPSRHSIARKIHPVNSQSRPGSLISNNCDSPRILPPARESFSSFNSFAALQSLGVRVAEDPASLGDDPSVLRFGDPSSVDDPLGDPIKADDPLRVVMGDPLAGDDPVGTGAYDPNVFDDPTAPKSCSSVPPVGDSAMSPSSLGGVTSSPSSSSSFSCTPLIARRVKLVDELEKKLGKQTKQKKKNRNAGNSKGKFSLKLDD